MIKKVAFILCNGFNSCNICTCQSTNCKGRGQVYFVIIIISTAFVIILQNLW
jgi:hypothetical protein